MEEESVLVSETGKKPMTLQQRLRKALETEGIDDVRVRAAGRGDVPGEGIAGG